ncbi:MAG: DUF5069 domain-containing protein [Nitrospina sp.]|jgi:hypothetical protein|nr:DUF5069 domain-containing protein [Nitrospina sp.]MBT3507989.1 DUF5069 domain-containing protein [Nitrospina sp.]MBT3876516.1 DUF5069 domain-containing protein [Nitrospina sp.]MBT4049535.1 DUF5069 domain-containing protein [Nitrospina sp.]MBT4557019.1 DUF5069 domain-containing protein [Nitrospina sp.]
MNQEKLKALAKDLNKEPPRSPRNMLGGYVILSRCLDKCRSFLLGINGEYNFWPCSLCSYLEAFSGVDHDEFKEFVATGANDDAVANWFASKSKVQDKMKIIHWNNKMRDMRISEMDDDAQEYMESYIPKYVPNHRPVYVLFDVYDLEEGRL